MKVAWIYFQVERILRGIFPRRILRSWLTSWHTGQLPSVDVVESILGFRGVRLAYAIPVPI